MNENQKPGPAENLDSNAAKAEETLNGKTKAELEQKLSDYYEKEWVIAHKEMLDAQWDYIQSM